MPASTLTVLIGMVTTFAAFASTLAWLQLQTRPMRLQAKQQGRTRSGPSSSDRGASDFGY